jgi:Na+/melibiose symporter-like transporter
MSTSEQSTPQVRKAKMWRIALFSMNNMSTNVAMMLIGYYMFFGQNVLGLSAVILGLLSTGFTVFDAITDPICGWIMDRTSTRFGKFRPFMISGFILCSLGFVGIFYCPQTISSMSKYIWTSVFYAIYVIGYTFQGTCTRAGLTVLTTDPSQRPYITFFSTVYNAIRSAFIAVIITQVLAPKFPEKMNSPELWKIASVIFVGMCAVLTLLAVFSISNVDTPEYYAKLSSLQKKKVKFSEYWPIIKHNRAFQMLILGSFTTRVGLMCRRGVWTYVFANLLLNVSLKGSFSTYAVPLSLGLSFLFTWLMGKFGQKEGYVFVLLSSIVCLAVPLLVGANPASPWIFLIPLMIQENIPTISATLPMCSDIADYEYILSGRFVPSMIGAAFTFFDKCATAIAPTIVGLTLAWAGYADVKIPQNEFISDKFNLAVMLCVSIVPIIGHVLTLICMKFYPLNKAKMKEISEELAVKKVS